MGFALLAALILTPNTGARATRPLNRKAGPGPARTPPRPNSPQASQTAPRSVCARLRILTGFKTAAPDA